MKIKMRVIKLFPIHKDDMRDEHKFRANYHDFNIDNSYRTSIYFRFNPMKPDLEKRFLRVLSRKIYPKLWKQELTPDPWNPAHYHDPVASNEIALDIQTVHAEIFDWHRVYVLDRGFPDLLLDSMLSKRMQKRISRAIYRTSTPQEREALDSVFSIIAKKKKGSRSGRSPFIDAI